MAQNITLLGASYSDVPAVTLPKTGGGTATFTDVTDTTAIASDVIQGKYFYDANGVRTAGTGSGGSGVVVTEETDAGGGIIKHITAVNLSGDTVTASHLEQGYTAHDSSGNVITGTLSPSASNIVQGTFTTGSTGGSTGTFTIPYTGSGYPIALMVVVKGGAYNNSSTGDTTWYNSVDRYDAGVFYMTKSRIPNPPSYASSGADNQGVTAVIYKNSTSTATTYTRTSSMSQYVYNSSSANATASNACVRFKGNGTTVSYYVGNRTSSTVGLARDTEFEYIAVYSE